MTDCSPPTDRASLRGRILDFEQAIAFAVRQRERGLAGEALRRVERNIETMRRRANELRARLRALEERERSNMATKRKPATKSSLPPRRSKRSNPAKAGREPAQPKDQKPAKNGKDTAIEVKRYTGTLRVSLTDSEVIERAQDQARSLQTIEDMEADLKSKNQHAKAAIQEREADVKKLSVEIRDRATYRPVDCERRFNFKTATVTEIRLDTGDVINERPMTYAELQRNLPLPPPGPPPGGDGAAPGQTAPTVEDDAAGPRETRTIETPDQERAAIEDIAKALAGGAKETTLALAKACYLTLPDTRRIAPKVARKLGTKWELLEGPPLGDSGKLDAEADDEGLRMSGGPSA